MPLLGHIRSICHRRIACLLPVLALAACATQTPGPTFSLHPGERIGVLVETADRPVHTHYEAVGSNSVRSATVYPYDWGLDAAVAEILQRKLKQGGLNVTDLESQGLRYVDLAGLLGADSAGQVPAEPLRARLREQGVRAVVLVRDARVLANRSCTDGPCERIAEGPGVYSSSANGVTSWRSVAGFEWHVLLLDPPGDLATAPPLRESLLMPSELLLGSARPHGTSEADLLPVRQKVLEYVAAVSEDVVIALSGRRPVRQQDLTPPSTPNAAPAGMSSGW